MGFSDSNKTDGFDRTEVVLGDSVDPNNKTRVDSDGNLTVESHGNNPDGSDSAIPISGVVASNSTSTPLLANGTFVGEFVDCSKYASVAVTILTDQSSAPDGSVLEFSVDGVNAGIVRKIDATSPASLDGLFYSIPCEAKFFRVSYTNGDTDQSVFLLETELKNTLVGASTLPLTTPLIDTTSAPLNRSVITGKSTDGTYTNKRSTGASTINSTSTPLLASGIFTGEFEEALGYSNLTIIVNADVESANDGLELQWSTDGVNIDSTESFTLKTEFLDGRHTFGVVAKFYRIVYTNGAVAQSHFRLQTILHVERPKPSSVRIDDVINGQNDAEIVKAVSTGKDPNGLFINRAASGIVNSNTSTTVLAASGVFTGEFIEITNYGGITISIDTDVDGTLEIQTSTNGIDVISTVNLFSITGGESFFIGLSPRRRYFRVKYTNGPVAQTNFDIQTIVTINSLSPSSQSLDSALSNNSIANNTRSILAGQREDGTFDNVDLSNSSSIKVAIADRPSEVRDRVHIDNNIENVTIDTTGTIIHTVTTGKTFYLTSLIVSTLNNVNTTGRYALRDGTVNKIPYLVQGKDATSSNTTPPLSEPIPFTTDVRMTLIAGDLTTSVTVVGYEE